MDYDKRESMIMGKPHETYTVKLINISEINPFTQRNKLQSR
jgi:hypothetical protein